MPRLVPGKGPPNAKIVIVGEAPGVEEERLGEPFVGASGNLLNSMSNSNNNSSNNNRTDNHL